MIYQIALSVALLILAFTTLKIQPDPSRPVPKPQTIEQPVLRSVEAIEPGAAVIRLIDPRLNETARWLSANFDLPYLDDPPYVKRIPSAQLHRLRYKRLLPLKSQAIGGEHATPPPEYRRELVAVYDDSARTIYMSEEWTGAAVAEQSVVVHEIVHHLQNLAGLKYECGSAREKPANLAQDRWLKLHGLELEKGVRGRHVHSRCALRVHRLMSPRST